MNAIAPEIRKRLADMYIAATRILDYLQKETLESFTADSGMVAQGFTAWHLTVIGEAATVLLKRHRDFCGQHPDIPLQESRRLRNLLVHEYDGIKWDAVWEAVHDELPGLIEALEPYAATWAEPEDAESSPAP